MSKLYFFYGAMNAGKSTHLLQVAHNYTEMGYRVAILKPAVDTKSVEVVSRLGVSHPIDASIFPNTDVFELSKNFSDRKCILIDEAQFISPQQAEELWRVAVELDIPVMAFGLRTDFLLHGFPGSARLLELAHSVSELKTMCPCGKRKAVVNLRVNPNTNIPELSGNQVGIDDGSMKYISICGECLVRFRNFPNQPISFSSEGQ